MDFSQLKTTNGQDVKGKRVLIRADLNVPLRDGKVSDATRITRVVPGIKDLQSRGARVIVLSHFGRPKGQPNPDFTLKPVADELSQHLASPATFVPDCIGETARSAASNMSDGDVVIFENVRFHPGEEKNNAEFARALAESGDIYVGEAFSCAHRAHASTEGITHYLPAFAGPLMMEEINALRTALDNPKRPTLAVVGGAKVSTKIAVLENLVAKVDHLIIGGGMANTFLQANGVEVGKSLSEPDFSSTARAIMDRAHNENCKIHLPTDAVVSRELKNDIATAIVAIDKVPTDMMILDVGPETVASLTTVLESCKTLLWNGPLGAFEFEPFASGTITLAQAAAKQTTARNLTSIAGGGDTVAALNAAGVTDQFTYVSTAGGAFLEWLEGRTLPGVAALASAHV